MARKALLLTMQLAYIKQSRIIDRYLGQALMRSHVGTPEMSGQKVDCSEGGASLGAGNGTPSLAV